MISTTLGDTARQQMLSHNMRRLKAEIASLTQEMSTGQVRDIGHKVQGDTVRVASLDKVIAESKARLQAFSVLTTRLDAQHAAVTVVHDHVQQVTDLLLRPDVFGTDDRLSAIAGQISEVFGAVVGLLNTQAGGQSLFAGDATDRPALADAQVMLADLAALVPAGADASVVNQIVADWFAPGGGFDLAGYLGGEANLVGHDLGDGSRLRFDLTATDPSIRKTLVGLAKGALMSASLTSVNPETRRSILASLGTENIAHAADLRLVIETIGISQARMDQAMTRQQAAQVAATMARTNLIAADPYETATALQDSIARMEQIFTITARLSRMSLSAYL